MGRLSVDQGVGSSSSAWPSARKATWGFPSVRQILQWRKTTNKVIELLFQDVHKRSLLTKRRIGHWWCRRHKLNHKCRLHKLNHCNCCCTRNTMHFYYELYNRSSKNVHDLVLNPLRKTFLKDSSTTRKILPQSRTRMSTTCSTTFSFLNILLDLRRSRQLYRWTRSTPETTEPTSREWETFTIKVPNCGFTETQIAAESDAIYHDRCKRHTWDRGYWCHVEVKRFRRLGEGTQRYPINMLTMPMLRAIAAHNATTRGTTFKFIGASSSTYSSVYTEVCHLCPSYGHSQRKYVIDVLCDDGPSQKRDHHNSHPLGWRNIPTTQTRKRVLETNAFLTNWIVMSM